MPAKQGFSSIASRRLAAILFADLEGFGALVASDEAGALALLGHFRDFAQPIFEEHGAEIADLTNDEFLALFDSATGAVQCALHLRLAARIGERRLGLRVGIHLGDIWCEDRHVYGNGVNIAARVKQAARGGEILLSEDVWRQVANKLDIETLEIQGLTFKNINRDLVLYRIVEAPADTAVEAPEALPSPEASPPSEVLPPSEAPLRKRKATKPSTSPKEASSESRLDQYSKARTRAWGQVLKSLLAGSAFGFFASGSGSNWLWAGALVCGVIPLVSGLRKAIEAGAKLRRIGKDKD